MLPPSSGPSATAISNPVVVGGSSYDAIDKVIVAGADVNASEPNTSN